MASEECCAVCAEPLRFVAVGRCGHTEVCSICSARMRGVMDDRECCICKAALPEVFITRYLGNFTAVPKGFKDGGGGGGGDGGLGLKARVKAGDLWHDDYLDAYFDDREHLREVQEFCRPTCSVCPTRPRFRNVNALKHHLRTEHSCAMCDICLQHKKVFVIEQKLYTKQQLAQHVRNGCPEVDGSKGMSGFSGHPRCEFCSKHFYGTNELYTHMQQTHFWCDICKRQDPNSFAYYKDYRELAKHFNTAHYPCVHPECLEKKFVVFQSETELKRHVAKEHSGDGGVSRSQMREASRIPLQFNVRGAGESSTAAGRSDRSRGRGRGADVELHDPSDIGRHRGMDGPPEEFPDWNAAPTPAEAASGSTGSDGGFQGDGGGPSSSLHRSQTANAGAPSWGMGARAQSTGPSSFPPLPGQRDAHNSRRSRANNRPPPAANYLNSANTVTAPGPPPSIGWADAPALPTPAARRSGGPAAGAQNTLASRLSASQTANVIVAGGGAVQSMRSQPQIPSGDAFGPPLSGGGRDRGAAAPGVTGPRAPVSVHEANRALIHEIREKLGRDSEAFSAFREVSGQYRAGHMGTAEYHRHAVSLGLGDLVPQLAALLPDDDKRMELMILHSQWVPTDGAEGGARETRGVLDEAPTASWRAAHGGGPERRERASHGARQSRKQVVSANGAAAAPPEPMQLQGTTTGGGGGGPGVHQHHVAEPMPVEPASAGPVGGDGDESHVPKAGGAAKKKRGRRPKFERLRLGDDFDAHLQVSDSANEQPQRRVNPYNSWTQGSGASIL